MYAIPFAKIIEKCAKKVFCRDSNQRETQIIIEEAPRINYVEIRNKVREAIAEYTRGSENLTPRKRALCLRPDGSYTLNIHEENTVHLGFVEYTVRDFIIIRIAPYEGFENAPEIREAFVDFNY